eukprot:1154050-Pelagomonas_calceolata.AAC.2
MPAWACTHAHRTEQSTAPRPTRRTTLNSQASTSSTCGSSHLSAHKPTPWPQSPAQICTPLSAPVHQCTKVTVTASAYQYTREPVPGLRVCVCVPTCQHTSPPLPSQVTAQACGHSSPARSPAMA